MAGPFHLMKIIPKFCKEDKRDMPFDEISIDLPELINQPYLCLNSMHRRAIPSIQIKTQTTVLVRKNR